MKNRKSSKESEKVIFDDEDEENNALANLVVQRLKKIKDMNTRDLVISKIINILYRQV